MPEHKFDAEEFANRLLSGSMGNMPYREYNGVPLKPKAEENCSRCGICAKHCPVGAIPADKPEAVNTSKCISCMNCVAVCPNHARSVNQVMLSEVTKKLEPACSKRKGNELFV